MMAHIKTIMISNIVLFVLSSVVYAQDHSTLQSTEHIPYEGMDVFQLEYVTDPRISPDGNTIIYTRRSNDIMTDKTRSSLWMINADGSHHRPLFNDKSHSSHARWSPSGNRIAYLSDKHGSMQLYLRWMDTGQTAVISDLRKAPSSVTWSPDGTMIAFTKPVAAKITPIINKRTKPKGAQWSKPAIVIDSIRYQFDGKGITPPAYQHIFTIPALGGTARQLTSGDFNHNGPLSWSLDNQHILFSANRDKDWQRQTTNDDIYRISLTGQLNQITDEPGNEQQPHYSPNGKKIAYLKQADLKYSYIQSILTVMNTDGSNVKTLTSKIDHSVSSFKWAKNNQSIYFDYDQRAVRKVASVNLKGKINDKVSGLSGTTIGRPYLSGEYSISNNGRIAFTQGSALRPADLAIYRSGKQHQLTKINEDALGHKRLAQVHEVIYRSSLDNQEIQGWYLTPADFDPSKKYPLIIEIHGGPGLAYGPYFSAELQQMAAAGYVVFYDNHRGSSSYGTEFSLLLHHKYSSPDDFADHMSGIDTMIEKGFIDDKNLFITGGSAGGIATAYAIGLTDRFNAAVAAKPVINWVSKTLTADSSVAQIKHHFPGMPWDHYQHYWQRSPLSLVGNVKTPTMLITGENDRRTPISETEQYYQALQLLGVETVMVRVPGSPHGIAGKPSRLLTKVDHILAWFKRYRTDSIE